MDLFGHLTEYAHCAQQSAEAQVGSSSKQLYTGYIAEWDGDAHTVTVRNPNNINPQTGNCVISQPMPLYTFQATPTNLQQNPINNNIERYGFQVAPLGGCQKNGDPTGEEVLVLDIAPGTGVGAVAFMIYNDTALPPGNEIPVSGAELQGGEAVWVLPTGTTIHLDNDGDLNIYIQKPSNQGTGDAVLGADGGISINTNQNPGDLPPDPEAGDIDVNAARDINMTAQRDITETAQRDINMQAQRDIIAQAQHNVMVTADNNISCQSTNNTDFTVGNNLTTIVAADASLGVTGVYSEAVGGDKDATVGGNETQTVTGNLSTQAATVTITAAGNIEIASAGLIELLASAINIGALAEALFPLLTTNFLTFYNTHTHPDAQGGFTGAPTTTVFPVYPIATQVLEAG